jgi:predicted RNase H-like HicB family nuclease
MQLTLETEQETDGRWIAEVREIPGALAYGASRVAAMVKAEALALRALAERLESGEAGPTPIQISIAAEGRVSAPRRRGGFLTR